MIGSDGQAVVLHSHSENSLFAMYLQGMRLGFNELSPI
jgi:hypothetical protein